MDLRFTFEAQEGRHVVARGHCFQFAVAVINLNQRGHPKCYRSARSINLNLQHKFFKNGISPKMVDDFKCIFNHFKRGNLKIFYNHGGNFLQF